MQHDAAVKPRHNAAETAHKKQKNKENAATAPNVPPDALNAANAVKNVGYTSAKPGVHIAAANNPNPNVLPPLNGKQNGNKKQKPNKNLNNNNNNNNNKSKQNWLFSDYVGILFKTIFTYNYLS
jgi:hypothetical protein